MMALATWQECYHNLMNSSDSSPGHDGLDNRTLKTLTNSLEVVPLELLTPKDHNRDSIPAEPTAIMTAIAFLVNECIVTRHVPPCLKVGWVTLVPKPKANGSFDPEPDKMRPITVLPALARLLSKILATRLGDIFTKHPNLLTPAQRAYIRQGTHSQCISTVLDVFEDHLQTRGRGKGRKRKPLYAVSYDQSSAFDRVQRFTIRATLERFNMPETFIELILSSMTGAVSRVKTAGGLTAPFTRQSSVPQGDPLSAILYTLVTDPLHEGLRDCPLFPEESKNWVLQGI